MLNCPFCDADLGAASSRLRGGRCPQCGSILEWADDAPAEPALEPFASGNAPLPVTAPPAAEERPAPPPPVGTPRGGARPNKTISDSADDISMTDIVRTLVNRGQGESQNSATINLDMGSVVPMPAAPAGGAPLVGSGRQIDLRAETPEKSLEHAAAAQPELNRIWAGSLTAVARPSMTLKASSAEPDPSISDLLIRPFKINEPGDQPHSGTEYELQEVIGEGGVGVVYAARQASIDRTVALKMLKGEFAHKRDHRNKFLSEAVVTGELDHPNIVPIYDLGASEIGSLFYAMKRVRGTPWSEVIRQQSLTENLRILMSVADAIAFAHSRGVIHRDLKPENVMLGDFGEVLVMDWGIALSTDMFVKSDRIKQSTSMGGTPAYMAPEMATGPLDQIGPSSDVYLLGALLYEIITGLTPHHGKDVMSCLYAAARNEIQPTDKSGELLDIARQAMATKPPDRYASVQDFQAAIREYQSHSESIVLSSRADEELSQARHSGDYQDYARALFAFQEAYKLWSGNDRAQAGEIETRLAYAGSAYDKGDYDLGLSLLDERHPEQARLRRKLLAAQRERDARKARFEAMRKVAVALVAAILLMLVGGLLFFRKQNDQLRVQKKAADDAKSTALIAQGTAETQKGLAEQARDKAQEFSAALLVAKNQANTEARLAREAEFRQAATSYLAQIGVSAERIDNNSFLDAKKLLAVYKSENPFFRHWEWAHLQHLCQLDAGEAAAGSRVESLAREEGLLAAGTADGDVRLWRVAWQPPGEVGDAPFRELPALKPGGSVLAVAIARGEVRLAAAGNVPGRSVQIFDRVGDEFGAPRLLEQDHYGVLAVAFSPNGERLVTAAYDGSVRLWDAASGKKLKDLFGHFGPVWSAAFLDDATLVTGGDDATVRLWNTQDAQPAPRIYRGHREPVFAVAATPHGRLVASAGRDRAIHLWRADMDLNVDFDQIGAALQRLRPGAESAPTERTFHEPDQRLVGHMAEVRALAFADDGSHLVSGGNDNTLRRWNIASEDGSSSAITLRGHGGWVRGCALAPGNAQLAVSGSHDKLVKLWDISRYEEVHVLRGHGDGVLWAAFSKDGQRIVTASRDRQALLWDAQTRERLKALGERPAKTLEEGHRYLVSSAAFFPGGDPRVVTSGGDGTVRIWDTTTGGQVRRLAETGTISPLALSPDGQWILTGSEGTEALLWRTNDDAEAPALRLDGHQVEVSAAAYSPIADAPRIVTGDVMGNLLLWQPDDAQGWKAAPLEAAHERGFGITAVRFSPDGSRIYSAAHDHTVMVHDARALRRLPGVLQHEGSVKALDISADGRRGVTLTSFAQRGAGGRVEMVHRVRLWDLARSSDQQLDLPLSTAEGATSVAFDGPRESALVATSSGDESTIWKWDFASNKADPLWGGQRLRGSIWSAVVSQDGDQLLAVGGSQGRLLARNDGRTVTTFSPHSAVTCASYSPDGRYVATSSLDGDVKLWMADPNSPEYGRAVFKLLRRHADDRGWQPVHFVAFSPVKSGEVSVFVTAGSDHQARLWRLTGGTPEAGPTLAHEGPVRSAVFAPNGRHVLTASDDGTARLWDSETGVLLATLNHNEDRGADRTVVPVLFADFSPDGTLVITGANDNDARVWDIAQPATPRLVHRLQGHTAAVSSAAISPDNRRALTGSQDGMAKLWHLPRALGPLEAHARSAGEEDRAQEVLSLKRHAAEVTSAHFSPDGRSVLTSSLDQTAILWPAVAVPPAIKLSSRRIEIAADSQPHALDVAAEVLDPDESDVAGGELEVILGDGAAAQRMTLDAIEAGDLRFSSSEADVLLLGESPVARVLESPATELRLALLPAADTRAADQLVRAIAVQIVPAPRQGAGTPTAAASHPVEVIVRLRGADGAVLSEQSALVQAAEESLLRLPSVVQTGR